MAVCRNAQVVDAIQYDGIDCSPVTHRSGLPSVFGSFITMLHCVPSSPLEEWSNLHGPIAVLIEMFTTRFVLNVRYIQGIPVYELYIRSEYARTPCAARTKMIICKYLNVVLRF